ncbi:MAG: nucleotide pyrophosphohydrolase [Gemmatimonadota bacterium]
MAPEPENPGHRQAGTDPHSLPSLTRLVRDFSQAREWGRFHTPKNLAMALAGEAAELMEPFQWLTPEEADALGSDPAALERVSQEMADVAIYLLRMADVMGVDLGDAVVRKVELNDRRFPVDEVRGKARMDDGGEAP